MVIAIDIILALIGIIIIIIHTAKGFIRSLFGFLKLAVAVAAAWILTPVVFPESDVTGRMLGYVLIFAGAYVITALVALLIDRIFRLPVLNATNKFLGCVFGVICAYIVISAVSSLLGVIIALGGGTIMNIDRAELETESYVYRFFSEYGIFKVIGNFI